MFKLSPLSLACFLSLHFFLFLLFWFQCRSIFCLFLYSLLYSFCCSDNIAALYFQLPWLLCYFLIVSFLFHFFSCSGCSLSAFILCYFPSSLPPPPTLQQLLHPVLSYASFFSLSLLFIALAGISSLIVCLFLFNFQWFFGCSGCSAALYSSCFLFSFLFHSATLLFYCFYSLFFLFSAALAALYLDFYLLQVTFPFAIYFFDSQAACIVSYVFPLFLLLL